ncbi:hypothetical protein PG997_000302 [Apiospora hydei]|uniref:AGC-kinase C-terminal domain-containing protein n=1 Tax=Apiospora hydei TaxID=1337664 RepID=A0ABR1XAL0_9PEZI
MLSHLRFHRRGPSNPTSPNPDSTSWDVQPAQLVPDDSSVPAPDIRPRSTTSAPQSQHAQARPQSPPLTSPPPPPQPQQAPPPPPSQAPPSLPPIARVASVSETEYSESVYSVYVGDPESHPREEPRSEPRSDARPPLVEQNSFLGGLKYRREQDAAAAAAATTSPRAGPSERSPSYSLDSRNSSRPNIASAVTSPPGRPPLRSSNAGSSFVSPTDLQHNTTTGKRPPGARVKTEPAPMVNQTVTPNPPKGKKSLPFLKNPMSTLLMRRKTSQNIPDLSLSLLNDRGKTSYEPIRGTRVHDFSAPRPKKPVSNNVSPMVPTEQTVPEALQPNKDDLSPPQRPAPPVPPKDDREQSGRSSASIRSRRPVSVDGGSMMQSESKSTALSASASRRITLMDPQDMRRKSSVPSSISTALSRNMSGMSGMSNKDVLSALPRHMKSTSSRFSFDMMGAANAEKLLEEKHRQRVQERQSEIPDHRDSRFDDFDEDPFEYDDLDYDDGLEERIPGVNADYDEEEEGIYEEPVEEYDPDNDQENFAGFVFQRSNPHSTLASPQDATMAATPRDAEGNVIGFAMTQGTPDINNRLSQLSVQAPEPSQPHSPVAQALLSGDSPTGLGIQGLDAAIHESDRSSPQQSQQKETSAPAPLPPLQPDDELYFGGAGLEGEGDGLAIDEALFDLEDTDQYGRPLPGVFASALARRQAAEAAEEQAKRESDDVTSRLSGATAITQSTAHTSVSVAPNQEPLPADNQLENNEKSSPDGLEQPVPGCAATTVMDNMAAYQAALAAAAHKAAASGKFRRDSDPPLPADVTITSPTTSGSDHSNDNINSFDDYEFDDGFDDGFGNGLDDYELDDDAIIAEANASALAHDSDGWYGQEFGFYAAPAQPIPTRNPNPGSDTSPFYGGFFGSNNGLARSKSGHLISREPNLTPITERSEYSNRNSIMSLMSPTTNRELSSLQSPGLAQLAMMADDDNMSLSALLRLRSKAWGDSQASLASSRDGSPSDRNNDISSPWSPEGREQIPNHDMYGRKNSAFSLWSQSAESGAASGSGSPTLTMSIPTLPNNSNVPPVPPLNPAAVGANPNLAAGPVPSAIPQPLFSPPPPPTTFPPVLEDEEVSAEDDFDDRASAASAVLKPSPISSADYSLSSPKPGVPSQKRPGMGHRHKGSADSISYIKEEGDGSEPRWVLERRRTAESGEIEVLEREIVEGGRI